MSQLFIPVGIPGCGKSTWGETFFSKRTDSIVSTDRIRASMGDVNDQSNNDEVFRQYHDFIAENLQDGFRVYADATNLDAFARTRLRDIAAANDSETHLIVFGNLAQACIRNLSRERVVPGPVMERMMDKYEKFSLSLGFEKTLYNSVTQIKKVG